MIRIYYINPVENISPYNAFKQPYIRVNKLNKNKRSAVGLSFSQHLELVQSLIKQ